MDRPPFSPHRRSALDVLTWTSLAGVCIVTATGVALFAVDLPRIARSLGLIAMGVVVGVCIVVQAWRRSRALRRLEQSATQMLAAGIPLRGGGGGYIGTDLRRISESNMPSELLPLADALAGLGHRIEVQLKDLAKKSRNLESLINTMDEPLIVTDNEQRVLLCNPSADAFLDSPEGGLLGRPISELFTQAQLLEMHDAARSGQTRRGRVRVTTALGKRVFQVSASPVPVAWGEGVFGAMIVLRDVTELDQAVQVRTDFVANASHELRTPVAAIHGAAETLQGMEESGDIDKGMARRLVGMILSHATRLEEMLRDLLDLSRLETPEAPIEIGPVDMAEIERTIRGLVEAHCKERRLTISWEMEPELQGGPGRGQLRTDRKLLKLILRNLVENATKFAHEGTTIRVVGSIVEEELPGATDNAGGEAREQVRKAVARFEVIDKGVGIPLNQQERVFERYYQVDPARGGGPVAGWRRGTGLGLAIVKHAAKALHGHAGLTSVWGQGTTVFIEVPVEIGSSGQ